MDEYKTCSKCKEIKLKNQFYKNKTKSDGYTNECIICRKAYWAINGTKIREKHRGSLKGKLKQLLCSAIHRARKHNLPYELNYEWLCDVHERQGDKCALTHLPFTYITKGDRSQMPFSPSLDRINPKLGYTKENTRLVCTAINVALNQHGEDIFSQVAMAYLGIS